MKIYDISKLLDSKTAIYPGNPEFKMQKVKKIDSDGYNLSEVTMGTHFGTHLDSPMHFIKGGKDVASIPIIDLMGECILLDLSSVAGAIEKKDLENYSIDTKILVLKTRNSDIAYDKFDPNFIYLARSAIKYIYEIGVSLICVDAPSVKKRGEKDFQHKYLFDRGINIIEGADLKDVKEGRYFFIALPLKLKDADGSPLRAVLIDNK
ncbi:cyclase family protein [Patescibacteria group bacterium]|nr:cyclase family protein [Patescibacteria group bacterium]